MPDYETYEIVPTDPVLRIEKKNRELEKDIQEIKTALKGAVGFSKLEANAEHFIGQMLDLLKTAQQLVSETAKSNKDLATKINEGLEQLNQTNQELSTKLVKILDFFAETAQTLGEGGMEGGGIDTDSLKSAFSEPMDNLKSSLDVLVDQNKKNLILLNSIEKNLKRQTMMNVKKRSENIAPQKSQEEVPPIPFGELPPPPMPPQ